MENEERGKKRYFFERFRKTVSLKGVIAVLLVAFGMIPMVLGTQTMLNSMRQSQIDSRMTGRTTAVFLPVKWRGWGI